MKSFLCMMIASSAFAIDPSQIKPQAEVIASSNPIHYWAGISFIYWYAKEDGLNAAESAQVDSSATTVFARTPAVFQQDFSFHPGFQINAGVSYANDWMLYGEYTYYQGTNQVSQDAPAGSVGVGVWNVDSWYAQRTFFSNQSLTGTKLTTTWKIGLNMLDLLLTRPLAEDKGFVYAPCAGIRTIWIKQKMNLELTESAASFGGVNFLGSQPTTSKNQSYAWGIGPRLGVKGKYNLPQGFNLNGSLGATMFFEKFTKIKHSESAAAIYYAPPQPINVSYSSVRPELDLSLGIGWGRAVHKTQHIDCMLSYDFLYFWGQNMMRYFTDQFFAGTSAGSLDLYFQGVTLKASYMF